MEGEDRNWLYGIEAFDFGRCCSGRGRVENVMVREEREVVGVRMKALPVRRAAAALSIMGFLRRSLLTYAVS